MPYSCIFSTLIDNNYLFFLFLKLPSSQSSNSQTEVILSRHLSRICKSEEKFIAERDELLEIQRREKTDKISETVYEYFGKNISPDTFKEAVEMLLTIDDAKEFIESEKEKLTAT